MALVAQHIAEGPTICPFRRIALTNPHLFGEPVHEASVAAHHRFGSADAEPLGHAASSSQPIGDAVCQRLAQASSPGVQILKAQHVPRGPAQKDPMAAMTGAALGEVNLPGHCLVQGAIDKRTGSDGQPYGIHFELRMPDLWSQRLLFQGGGGLDGFLANALGRVPVMTSTA